MILPAIRLLGSVSLRQWIVFFISTIIPAIILPLLLPRIVEGLALTALVYSVWIAIAILFFAFMLKRDRAEAEERTDRKVANIAGKVHQLEEEQIAKTVGLQDQVTDLQNQVNYLDGAMQTASEKLGFVLPTRRYSLRSRPAGSRAATSSAKVEKRAGDSGTMIRLLRWVHLQAILFRRLTYRTFWDWDNS